MKFNLSQEKVDDLKDYVIKLLKHQISYNEFWALKDINFTLNKGDRLGILGLNGAGKSTLLKVIAGVLKATEGTVLKMTIASLKQFLRSAPFYLLQDSSHQLQILHKLMQ